MIVKQEQHIPRHPVLYNRWTDTLREAAARVRSPVANATARTDGTTKDKE